MDEIKCIVSDGRYLREGYYDIDIYSSAYNNADLLVSDYELRNKLDIDVKMYLVHEEVISEGE